MAAASWSSCSFKSNNLGRPKLLPRPAWLRGEELLRWYICHSSWYIQKGRSQLPWLKPWQWELWMFSYSSFAEGNLASRFLQTERLFLVVGEWSRDEDECVCYSKRQSSRSRTPPPPIHTRCAATPSALCSSGQVLEWLENPGLQRARPKPGPVAWMGLPLDTQSSSCSEPLGHTKLCSEWIFACVGGSYLLCGCYFRNVGSVNTLRMKQSCDPFFSVSDKTSWGCLHVGCYCLLWGAASFSVESCLVQLIRSNEVQRACAAWKPPECNWKWDLAAQHSKANKETSLVERNVCFILDASVGGGEGVLSSKRQGLHNQLWQLSWNWSLVVWPA